MTGSHVFCSEETIRFWSKAFEADMSYAIKYEIKGKKLSIENEEGEILVFELK